MNFEWSYLSASEGIGGDIKRSPEDFTVEEITPDGTVLELYKTLEYPDSGEKYTQFILQKKDWSTSSALKRLAKALRVGQKRFSYAGTKDKVAVTTQRVSVFGVPKESITSLALMDLQINGAWGAKEQVQLGDLLGNRFRIVWNGDSEGAEEKVSSALSELNGKFPNYFGPQRFGSTRQNTHRIGELLLRKRFQEAAMHFLAETGKEEHKGAREARSHLLESGDFASALKEFPKHLKLERTMLAYLSENPEDFIGAFRKLPRYTLLLFVHAFQSYLFNECLSERIKDGMVRKEDGEFYCSSNSYGFPEPEKPGMDWLCGKLLGYTSTPNEREKALLERHEISLDAFKIDEMPELSSKGHYRPLLSTFKDFEFKENVFRFSLPAGSYATSALREFMKTR
ncbi:MAG: tRNA pseudouridine(13) synthase TruD [bacterium]|nr:tRNA pseudouridine(13) synthase TruD [bacterium]